MLDHLAPARRRVVLATVGLVAVAVLTIAAVVVAPRLGGADVDPVPQDAQPPVLLVPGYGGGTAASRCWRRRCARRPRRDRRRTWPATAPATCDEQADVLDSGRRARCERAGAASVDVVGYSAGGVIARLWVATDGGGSSARRVVTLGSPHHGTDLAGARRATSLPTAARRPASSWCPDSDLLRRLNAGDETPAGPRWVSIWTTDDQIVVAAGLRARSTAPSTSRSSRSARGAASRTATCPATRSARRGRCAELGARRRPPPGRLRTAPSAR